MVDGLEHQPILVFELWSHLVELLPQPFYSRLVCFQHCLSMVMPAESYELTRFIGDV